MSKLDKNFKIYENIIAEKIDISNKEWILQNVIITDTKNLSNKLDRRILKSNFDLERINNLFSDLSSLTYFELLKLEKDYISIGYSTDEINIQKHKFYSLPILLCIMTIIGTIIMIYNKFKKNLLRTHSLTKIIFSTEFNIFNLSLIVFDPFIDSGSL